MPIRYLNRSRGSLGSSFYDFTLGTLPAGVSFAAASARWRWNAFGVLVQEAVDVPRFQYDPATLTPRGLLIEDAATNLYLRSAELDNAAWTKTRASVTANAATAPDGTTAMDLLVEDGTAGATHQVTSAANQNFTSGTPAIVAFFAKALTRNWVNVAFPPAAFSGGPLANFNVSTGALGTVSAGVTAFIFPVGGGVYLCVAIATPTSTIASGMVFRMASADNTVVYNGDGTSGLYLWGLHIETAGVGALSSYIPTTSSAVTRAADIALVTNPSGLADQVKVIKFRTPRRISGGAVNVAWQRDDGTTGNRELVRYGSDGKIHVIASVGGVDQCDLDMGAVAADTDVTIAARFTAGAFAASLNGGAIVTYGGGSRPSGLTTERLGKGVSGFALNSTMRSLWSLPTASNTDLPLLAA